MQATLLSLTDIQNRLATESGSGPSKATIRRWMKKGLAGIRLRSRKVGRSAVTTEQWLAEFIDLTTGDATEGEGQSIIAATAPKEFATPDERRRKWGTTNGTPEKVGFLPDMRNTVDGASSGGVLGVPSAGASRGQEVRG